jgi:hypothetical protein
MLIDSIVVVIKEPILNCDAMSDFVSRDVSICDDWRRIWDDDTIDKAGLDFSI